MLNRNKENTPYIRTLVKDWLNKIKVEHKAYSTGFVCHFPENTLLITFEIYRKQPDNVYTVVQHYPYNKLQVKFPCNSIDKLISKLNKFKLL